MSDLRVRMLKGLIEDAAQCVGSSTSKIEVFSKKNYLKLDSYKDTIHVLLDSQRIETIRYYHDVSRTDAEGSYVYMIDHKAFDYFDDFLVDYFGFELGVVARNSLIGSGGYLASSGNGNQYDIDQLRTLASNYKDAQSNSQKKLLEIMRQPKFFMKNIMLGLKIRNKEYYPFITYFIRFSAYIFIAIYAIGYILNKDMIYFLMAGLIFLASIIFLRVESAYYEYKHYGKVKIDIDRMLGIAVIVFLLVISVRRLIG